MNVPGKGEEMWWLTQNEEGHAIEPGPNVSENPQQQPKLYTNQQQTLYTHMSFYMVLILAFWT